MLELRCRTESSLPEVAESLLNSIPDGVRIVLLNGTLGAGKTALVKQLVRLLKANDEASSPTFSLINEYSGPEPIVHIDLYRLESVEEAMDIGIEDYFYSGNWVFVEWPELILPIVPEEHVIIEINVEPDSSRIFRIFKNTTSLA